jgi:hypothetical protein
MDPSNPRDALSSGSLGLYDAALFRAVDGRCPACPTPKQALWYFENDVIGVPRNAVALPAPDSSLRVADDVRQWLASGGATYRRPPFLIWLGSRQLIEGASMQLDGKTLQLGNGKTLPLSFVAKLSSNRAYYDQSSTRFFSKRSARLRGSLETDSSGRHKFIARVIWPEDFRVDASTLSMQPLVANETLATLIDADNGGAESPFATRLLWRRGAGGVADLDRKPVIGFLLNGAQGDDDEAHGGHFAVITGWHRRGGALADWLVNNFYSLDTYSEKGIIASMLPLDNYLADLNSGQSYYRPSYLLVVVLRDSKAADLYQDAIQRVFDRFYRHEIEYDNARANCAGLSLDTLTGLGWQVPKLGPTSRARAVFGYYYSVATERSFASGRKTYRYLTEERTRLFPRAAFEVLGNDLLGLLGSPNRQLTAYELLLRDQTEAVVFVRVPQIPSSRVFGNAPVASYDEYMARVPKNRKDWKIIPVDPRPFPSQLRERVPVEPMWSDTRVGLIAVAAPLLLIATPLAWWRSRRSRRKRERAN